MIRAIRPCLRVALLAIASLAVACAPGDGGKAPPNQAPTVWLAAAPPEGSTTRYTVQLFWGGWDPDGEISHYQYLISDNRTGMFNPTDTVGVAWKPVLSNDSTFIFSADRLVDTTTTKLVSEFTRSHTFFIRAVDEEGRHSAEPAYRSFTARTLSPSVSITVPVRRNFTPADLPPIATYRWKATDYVENTLTSQDPDSVQVALVATARFSNDFVRTINYLRTSAAAGEWRPWTYYRAPGDSGKFWTTPPTDFGNYVFAVRAKDEAGAVTPVLDEAQNVRRVRVSRRTTGPLMTLKSLFLGQIRTSSCSTPLTIVDIPAGVPVEFTITAEAEHYGGTVAGYRYGWDIPDLNNPDLWDIDLTPFVASEARVPPRTFFFGTHVLTTEVVDNSGFCSRIEVKVNIIQFSLERNLLIVDDFKPDEDPSAGWNGSGRGSLPNDAEHDAFWADMVSGVDGFDPLRDMVSTTNLAEIPLPLLASYKSIIWNAYGDVGQSLGLPLLYTYIQFRSKNPSGNQTVTGKVTPNVLALTMAAGGHLMICGRQPVQNVLARTPGRLAPRFPYILLYELEGTQTGTPDVANPVGDQSFGYKELCLETLDFSLTSTSLRRGQQQYCPITFLRVPNANSVRDDTMREARPLDPRFPALALRAEVTRPGKYYQPSEQGVDAEVYNPAYFRTGTACQYVPRDPRPCFQPIYGLGCNDTAESTFDQPVAFFTSAFADRVADAPGAVAAKSVVWGFPPVLFDPAQVKPAMEIILFDEWKLPRKVEAASP